MIYDAQAGYLLLFGGLNQSGCGGTCQAALNDTWAFSGGHWTQLHPHISPAPRLQMGMAYNGASGRVVLFGGLALNGYNFNDTWTFYNGNWTNITTIAGTPPARHNPAMTWDGKDGYVLMFGGSHRANGGQPVIGDTWKFAGGFWSQIGTCGGPSQPGCGAAAPPPRYQEAATYDATDRYVLLFGGSTGSVLFSDTWTYVNGTWTNLTAGTGASPRPNVGAAMAFFPALGKVVLVGGENATSVPKNATWTWAKGKWVHLNLSALPPARFLLVLGFNPGNSSLILFGGAHCWPPTNSCTFGDTWSFSKTRTWTQL